MLDKPSKKLHLINTYTLYKGPNELEILCDTLKIYKKLINNYFN